MGIISIAIIIVAAVLSSASIFGGVPGTDKVTKLLLDMGERVYNKKGAQVQNIQNV